MKPGKVLCSAVFLLTSFLALTVQKILLLFIILSPEELANRNLMVA